jgi:uncharacterized protein (TIGR03435 family)
MQDFAHLLSGDPSVDRIILDETGLRGTYVFMLAWAADENIRTAVEDQFGLKFESQKAPVDTVVIDHIEKPDPN